MPLLFNDPQHWHERAAEARGLAEQMTDLQGKESMIEIGKIYDQIAERALQRTAKDLTGAK